MDSRNATNKFTKWLTNREIGGKKPIDPDSHGRMSLAYHQRVYEEERAAREANQLAQQAQQLQMQMHDGGEQIQMMHQGAQYEVWDDPPQDQEEPVLGSMKHGGMIGKTGLYRLHKGEMVVPAKDVATVKKYIM